MKISWKSTVYTFLLFGAGKIGIEYLEKGEITTKIILTAIIAGAFFALMSKFFFEKSFTWLALKFTKNQFHKIQIIINKDERLILEAGANHIKGVEGVGGKIALTDKRLIFKSHRLNIQNHEESIALGDIKNMEEGSKDKIATRKLLIHQLINNEVHKFVVESPSELMKSIQSLQFS